MSKSTGDYFVAVGAIISTVIQTAAFFFVLYNCSESIKEHEDVRKWAPLAFTCSIIIAYPMMYIKDELKKLSSK